MHALYVRLRIPMISFILDVLFYGFCHWVGVVTIKTITLGKIDLSFEDPSEFFFVEWIGVGVLLVIATLIVFVVNANRDGSSNADANKQSLSVIHATRPQSFSRRLASLENQLANRVGAGIEPAPPTPPGMRV